MSFLTLLGNRLVAAFLGVTLKLDANGWSK